MIRALARWVAAGFDIIPSLDRPRYDGRMVYDDAGTYAGRRLLKTNVVMSPIQWVQRVITEAEVIVERRTSDDTWVRTRHPIESVLNNPNPYYGWDELLKAVTCVYFLTGNAYVHGTRRGTAIQNLWWLPTWNIRVRGTAHQLITHYEYRPPGTGMPVRIPPMAMTHVRFGIDPRDTRYGFSPIAPVIREAAVDVQAAKFSEAIMRNLGVPGVIVSPKVGAWKETEVEDLREYMSENFVGEGRGGAFVMQYPAEMKQLGFDPNRLMVGPLRDVSEERVCSAIGLPATIVGFGAGLQSTKVGATMREMVTLARIGCVQPTLRTIARAFSRTLFFGQPGLRISFDVSKVGLFNEDLKDAAERAALLFEKGLVSREVGQDIAGVDRHDVGGSGGMSE